MCSTSLVKYFFVCATSERALFYFAQLFHYVYSQRRVFWQRLNVLERVKFAEVRHEHDHAVRYFFTIADFLLHSANLGLNFLDLSSHKGASLTAKRHNGLELIVLLV